MNRELKYNPPDIQQFTKGNLTKEMAIILRGKVDEPKMGKEEKEYWDGVKDGDDEEDEYMI